MADQTREPGSPATALSDKELIQEAKALHTQFEGLAERYREAPVSQRAEIREEMQPIVNRERELRSEATTRQGIEIDRVPKVEMGYGR